MKITKYTTLTGNYAGSGRKLSAGEDSKIVPRPRAYTEVINEKDEENSNSNPS